jgi:hypothetical protein
MCHADKRRIKKEKDEIMAHRGTIKFERFCLDLVNEIAFRGVRRLRSGTRKSEPAVCS